MQITPISAMIYLQGKTSVSNTAVTKRGMI